MTLVDHVRRALVDDGLLPADRRLLVACSGGPDSRVLLESLVLLRPSLGLDLKVATVDHGIRPESAAEAAGVVAICAAHGVPATVLSLHLGRASSAKARSARYLALTTAARSDGISTLVVAHTATDQAETLLHRLVRGSGLAGLGAMAPSRWEAGVRLVRPLLTVSSATVEAFVADHNLAVARDPTNRDLHHIRARIRHRILPLLREEHPDLDAQLEALCGRLRDDEAALDAVATAFIGRAHDGQWLDLPSWCAEPKAIQMRVLRRLGPPSLLSCHLQALAQLCAARDGSQLLSLPGGVVAERAYGRLRFRSAITPTLTEISVAAPGEYAFGVRRITIAADVHQRLAGDGELVLRGPRPGDRVPGHGKKLGRHLIDRKVPVVERSLLPILARRTMLSEDVVWVGSYPNASEPEPVR